MGCDVQETRKDDYDPSIVRWTEAQKKLRFKLEQRYKHAWNARYGKPQTEADVRRRDEQCFTSAMVTTEVIERMTEAQQLLLASLKDFVTTEFEG